MELYRAYGNPILFRKAERVSVELGLRSLVREQAETQKLFEMSCFIVRKVNCTPE